MVSVETRAVCVEVVQVRCLRADLHHVVHLDPRATRHTEDDVATIGKRTMHVALGADQFDRGDLDACGEDLVPPARR